VAARGFKFSDWRLGRQSSCDSPNAHKDDEELEGQGKAAIWFDLVNSRKQEGGNELMPMT
jgi:hypothetical protein